MEQKTLRQVAALISVVFVSGCGNEPGLETFTAGLEFYRANQLAKAISLFERATRDNDRDASVHAWYAETARRLERFDEAEQSARTALIIEPCSSFAHTVLANTYHPALSDWAAADADSSWTHARAATACDPLDGNAQIAVWGEAQRRGEREIERESLRSLIETEFIPRPVIEFNRWMLRSLPPDAVLVTSGDWDTFPALGLQIAEGYRQDVAVANINMLNLEWYTDVMRRRHDIPSPTLARWDNSWRHADSVVIAWRDASVRGVLGRPLTFALTLSTARIPAGAGSLRLEGPYRRLVRSDGDTTPDAAAMRTALDGLRAEDFVGATTSPNDRSAVRIASDLRLPIHVVYVAAMYAQTLVDANRLVEASETVRWAEQFASNAGVGEDVRGLLNLVREAIEQI